MPRKSKLQSNTVKARHVADESLEGLKKKKSYFQVLGHQLQALSDFFQSCSILGKMG